MPLTPGITLQNRYRIVSLLGQGGMGTVYRAWHIGLNVPVAIKENLDTSPQAQKQFVHEGQILARLSHPNLPRVIDYFFIPGQGQYLVMDFVEGEDLQSMLSRLGRLPETQVLGWINQVCGALAYLHSQPSPIIHRDIKPANIKIRPDGQAILVDFGIAKVFDPRLVTTIGAKAVTPGYSPPEQYGGGKTDIRSDIYAMGATLFTLLTSQQPPESVERATGTAKLLMPRMLNPQINPATEAVIVKAMDLAAERRFQSAQELRLALSGSLSPGMAVVSPGPPGYPASLSPAMSQTSLAPPASSPPIKPGAKPFAWGPILLIVLGGAVLLVALIALVLFSARLSNKPEPAAAPALATVNVAATAVLPTSTAPASPTLLPHTATPPPTSTIQPTDTSRPTSTTPSFPLQDGDIIALESLGTIEGPRWLDGRTGEGTVGLAPTTEGEYTGTRWQVYVLDNDVITLKCLGYIEGPRWLDGRTGEGTVRLAPSTGGEYTGTRWQVQVLDEDVIALKCLGHIEGPRWLDGKTADGSVGLAPNTLDYSGTLWQIIFL